MTRVVGVVSSRVIVNAMDALLARKRPDAGKAGGDRIGTGNLIQREGAGGRPSGIGDPGASLCAYGECDGLAGHPRRSPAKGKDSRKRNRVVVVAE